jgi:demethylmenaquinone methyltransferase/2-methoxy-6-polyprenyl-1,4-benzoquinol methylase
MDLPEQDSLVAEQIDYYRARAPEYDDWWRRTGRYEPDDAFARRWEAGKRELEYALEVFAPSGQVLEIAAGTGNLTASLARLPDVEHITAIDAAEEALAIARTKVDPARATFTQADVFQWEPPRQFDIVAFGFWLSHVPEGRFEAFWTLVREALRPRGRVFFTDNAVPVELAAAADDCHIETPWSRTWVEHGVSERILADGRRFHIVKRSWTPAALEAQLTDLGWTASVTEHQELFLHGEAT